MANQDADRSVRRHIERLVGEEQDLYSKGNLSEDDRRQLQQLKIELDQCWDLLRQRRALREFDENPARAKVRPPSTVEGYEQ